MPSSCAVLYFQLVILGHHIWDLKPIQQESGPIEKKLGYIYILGGKNMALNACWFVVMVKWIGPRLRRSLSFGPTTVFQSNISNGGGWNGRKEYFKERWYTNLHQWSHQVEPLNLQINILVWPPTMNMCLIWLTAILDGLYCWRKYKYNQSISLPYETVIHSVSNITYIQQEWLPIAFLLIYYLTCKEC